MIERGLGTQDAKLNADLRDVVRETGDQEAVVQEVVKLVPNLQRYPVAVFFGFEC